MLRSISPMEVEMLLSEPDGVIEQSMDKAIYYKYVKKRKDNALAAVAVHSKNNHYEVITVMVNFRGPE